MKLKIYLRGLAVGILITTLIFTVGNRGSRPLTDAEIRERALALGMEDGTSKKLSSLQQGGTADGQEAEGQSEALEDTSGAEQSGALDDVSGMEESETLEDVSGAEESDMQPESLEGETQTPDNGEGGDGLAEAQPASPSDASGTQQSETPKDEPETQPQAPDNAEGEPVTIQIKRGDGSYSVSRDLAAAGLISDAEAFDLFLCDNGYSKKIRTGVYKIMPGTSEKEIAEMIAH